MSERIQELYMQAIEYADSVVPVERRYNDIYYAIAAGKHAQLIIQECAIIANRAENTETEIRCMYDVITEHFGVEE